MPSKPATISSPDFKRAWKALISLGEKPVAAKFHPDGTFRILTEKCLKNTGQNTVDPNEWDVVLQ